MGSLMIPKLSGIVLSAPGRRAFLLNHAGYKSDHGVRNANHENHGDPIGRRPADNTFAFHVKAVLRETFSNVKWSN